MFASALRWLLVIALVLNGMAAPHAMTVDAGSDEAPVSRMPSDCGTHAKSRGDVAGGSVIAAHPDHAFDRPIDDATADVADADCCDGAGCNCGCLHAPLLRAAEVMLRAFAPASSVAAVGDASAGMDRRRPPLRPPSA